MEYPLGANYGAWSLQAHPSSGIQKPGLRPPCTLRVLKSADTAQVEVLLCAITTEFSLHLVAFRGVADPPGTKFSRLASAGANRKCKNQFSLKRFSSHDLRRLYMNRRIHAG
jgi:hypothetical protein